MRRAAVAYPLSIVRNPQEDPADVWLRKYLRVQRKYDKRIEQHLVSARDDVERAILALSQPDTMSAGVRRAQLIGAHGGITRVLKALYEALGDTTRAGLLDASLEAMKSSVEWSENVIEALDIDPDQRKAMINGLTGSSTHAVQAMMTRILDSERPLSSRIWTNYRSNKARIDRIVNSHIVKGSSAADLAKDVKAFVDPKAPGGVSYSAKRLARTEMNNAFHAQSINAAQQFPWIHESEWRLSGSHPTHSPGDKCEVYARQGRFPNSKIPNKPHPNCLCYIVPVVPDITELWADIQDGKYDSWVEEVSQ